MKEFLFNYGWIILLAVFVGVYFFWYFKKFGRDKALKHYRVAAYKLMLLAEKRFGDGEGRIKFIWVIERFYPVLPKTLNSLYLVMQLKDGYNFYMMRLKTS